MNREKAIEFLASGKRVYAVGGHQVLAGTINSVFTARTADGVTLETSCQVVSSDDNDHIAIYDATDIFETPHEAYYQCLSRSVYALQRELDLLEQWRREEEESNGKKEKKNG